MLISIPFWENTFFFIKDYKRRERGRGKGTKLSIFLPATVPKWDFFFLNSNTELLSGPGEERDELWGVKAIKSSLSE